MTKGGPETGLLVLAAKGSTARYFIPDVCLRKPQVFRGSLCENNRIAVYNPPSFDGKSDFFLELPMANQPFPTNAVYDYDNKIIFVSLPHARLTREMARTVNRSEPVSLPTWKGAVRLDIDADGMVLGIELVGFSVPVP